MGGVRLEYKDSDVIKLLRQISKTDKQVMDELVVTGLRIETIAKELETAVDTSRLRNSIHTETDRLNTATEGDNFRTKAEPGEVLVGTNVNYAEIIHSKGGKQGRGKAFLSEAFMYGIGELRTVIAKKILKK
jgi:phage gpG-like protein